jgi:hypothetical protein
VSAGVFTFPVVIACAVLVWAGLEKIRAPSSLAATVRALGGPPRFATISALIVPIAELVTVILVVAGAPAYLPAALFAVLGTAFAAAGLRAIGSRTEIPCACFGVSERKLGWPQVAVLPLWLLAAWSVIHMPAFGLRARLETSAVAIVLLTVSRAVSAVRHSVAARRDRRAFAGG